MGWWLDGVLDRVLPTGCVEGLVWLDIRHSFVCPADIHYQVGGVLKRFRWNHRIVSGFGKGRVERGTWSETFHVREPSEIRYPII